MFKFKWSTKPNKTPEPFGEETKGLIDLDAPEEDILLTGVPPEKAYSDKKERESKKSKSNDKPLTQETSQKKNKFKKYFD